ncbi:hypothetical protein Avbf_04134 [Armadillidium vulgare]|nr:hypothetical protein Avbf_04134 [Armadillidium vulgare]
MVIQYISFLRTVYTFSSRRLKSFNHLAFHINWYSIIHKRKVSNRPYFNVSIFYDWRSGGSGRNVREKRRRG